MLSKKLFTINLHEISIDYWMLKAKQNWKLNLDLFLFHSCYLVFTLEITIQQINLFLYLVSTVFQVNCILPCFLLATEININILRKKLATWRGKSFYHEHDWVNLAFWCDFVLKENTELSWVASSKWWVSIIKVFTFNITIM